MLELPRPKPTGRVRQLEWPQEVACLLEVRPHGHDLMHQIFHTDNTKLAEVRLDDLVVGERDTLLVNLSVSALVDEVADGFHARVAVGDVRLDYFEHLGSGFGEFDEDAVVDLEKTEELHNLAGFGGHFIDTEGSH